MIVQSFFLSIDHRIHNLTENNWQFNRFEFRKYFQTANCLLLTVRFSLS